MDSKAKLNSRSRITIRYTSNPADMGYDGIESNWLTAPGETMGIRHASNFAAEDIPQRIGQGTFFRIEYRHRGQVITLDAIWSAVIEMDYNRIPPWCR